MTKLWNRIRSGVKRTRVTANPGLKAGALLLAFALWLFVASEETGVIELTNVPLKMENIPSGWEVTGSVPETVAVRLTGDRSSLERISPAEVSAVVDLSRAQQGEQIVLLDKAVRAPFGVEVERISPPQLNLRLEMKVVRKIPIQPNLTGEVPQGYQVRGTTVEPKEAQVRGAESAVAETASVTTQPVPLNGRRNSFTMPVRVLPPHGAVQIVAPTEAAVRVSIEEIRERRSFRVPVEMVGEAGGRTQINPRDLSVTLEGPASMVATIQAADIRVALDVKGLEPRSADYHLDPVVSLRRPGAFAGVEIVDLSQQRIDVHVYPGQE